MKPPRLTLNAFRMVALTLLVGLAGCTVSGQADVADVEITQHDVTFTGIPFAGRVGDVATELTFTQDKPSLGLPKSFDTSAKAIGIDLVAKKGITSFDFLRSLRVTMAPTDGSSAPAELIDYERADGSPTGSATLTIPSKNPVDLLEQWKTDSATFRVEVAGTLPEQDWSVDLGVRLSGKVSYSF